MKNKRVFVITALALGLLSFGIGYASLRTTTANIALSSTTTQTNTITADSPISPTTPVKLIFIHHSTGGNWLADPNMEQYYGGLGQALMDNNYFVSATNYGWGPDMIGLNTDIGYWWDWFRGDNAATYMAALYAESGQNFCNPTADPPYECFGEWPRLATDPGGPNEIIMFKGCFPNAHMSGNPTDPPTSGANPLRGESAWVWDEGLETEVPNPNHTVANAKGIYNDLLVYFAAHQEKLFVVITGPPLLADDIGFPTDATHAANYRAFNEWLVNDWLDGYAHNNVAVFDYYNVLTSNGGDPDTNDAGLETGNHHRWWNGAMQHVSPVDNDLTAYGVSMDSHPATAGQQKATAEFVQVLNVFYNRWKGSSTPTQPSLTLTRPNGGENWGSGTQQEIQWTSTGTIAQVSLAYSTDGFATDHQIVASTTNNGNYIWTVPNNASTTARVRVASVVSPTTVRDDSDANFAIYTPGTMDHFIYLPVVLRNYNSTAPTCAVPLTGVTISGPTDGVRSLSPSLPRAPAPHPLAANAPTAQPTGLTAFHRSGQTFLTWNEDTGSSGESYHVYRHTAPINAGNIAQATRLTAKWGPLPEGASIFYTDRDRDPSGNIIPGLQNYVITDLGAPLTDTVGLFVWTTKQAGDFYYAVTTVASGVENQTDFGAGNSLASPVTEAVADPDPILVWESPSGNGRVYTQFMDFETFNPTFERPTAHPEGGLQYAYNYWVGLPTSEMCDGTVPSVLPVLLHIEGYGSRYAVEGGDNSTYYCAAEIWGDDPRQSWYYGFSATYDYRTGDPLTDIPTTGPIVNYAEARLLRAVYDTLRDPYYHIDPQRIYVYGHSMGGSGALALAMRYPNVFAASYSSEPMTDYQTSSVFSAECETKWGSISANLPISNVGRYAGPLAAYNGTGVWDWQNHQANLVNRIGDDMAHISLAHGTLDGTIEWSSQGLPVYAAFYAGRRAFSGATLEDGHSWIGYSGMGPNVTADLGTPFYNFNVVRNETLPGLTYASGSSVTPPPGADAAYNLNLEWSASWDDWDGAPVDTAGEWRISLRTTDSSNQTVAVTPRRVQTFVITPGDTYTWENHRVSDGGLVASGSVAADSNGLVTVADVAVSPEGNRLSLHPGSGPILPTLTLAAPNGGESWQVGSQHAIQWTSTGSIANVSLAYSTDGFASSHPIIASTANTGSYTWSIPDEPATTARVRVSSVVTPSISDDSNANFTIQQAGGPTTYVFTATIAPANATPPVAYTWSPAPTSGQETAVASYQWVTPGAYIITVSATNCGGTVSGQHTFTIGSAPTQTVRSMPDTTNGIHVFNDQLANMSEEQFEFAATHYAGTQKMTRADADHLRTYNPDFVILHYRLGMGLGYRGIESGCTPNGDWLAIIEGNDWVQEWPGDGNVVEDWFYHWPEAGTTRVLNCDWGWYLMNLDNAAWRAYWSGEVLRQLQANDDDGIFADSFSVPNYLGYDHYNPNLPELDNTFESQWTTRLNNFMTYVQQGSLAVYHFIPNAGQWVTSRETTDYAIADGVMIEGFGSWGASSYFDLADWQLQMDRVLGLVNQDKIILAQQYINADDVNDRMFLLGSYLLIKGRYTYINFDLDLDPEWFPEYAIPIGSPSGGTPANIAALWNAGWGVYTRTYSNGRVLVNPTDTTQTVALGQTYYQATPNGGGFVPANGDVSGWTVGYAPVTSVELASNQAAILLNTAP